MGRAGLGTRAHVDLRPALPTARAPPVPAPSSPTPLRVAMPARRLGGSSARAQLSAHSGFANRTMHACAARCAILHANHWQMKCVAAVLRAAPSCARWAAFRESLARPPVGAADCLARNGLVREQARRAIRAYFADCCVADGSPDANAVEFDAKNRPF